MQLDWWSTVCYGSSEDQTVQKYVKKKFFYPSIGCSVSNRSSQTYARSLAGVRLRKRCSRSGLGRGQDPVCKAAAKIQPAPLHTPLWCDSMLHQSVPTPDLPVQEEVLPCTEWQSICHSSSNNDELQDLPTQVLDSSGLLVLVSCDVHSWQWTAKISTTQALTVDHTSLSYPFVRCQIWKWPYLYIKLLWTLFSNKKMSV